MLVIGVGTTGCASEQRRAAVWAGDRPCVAPCCSPARSLVFAGQAGPMQYPEHATAEGIAAHGVAAAPGIATATPWYAVRRDTRPTVVMGYRSVTIETEQTYTSDRQSSHRGRVSNHLYQRTRRFTQQTTVR